MFSVPQKNKSGKVVFKNSRSLCLYISYITLLPLFIYSILSNPTAWCILKDNLNTLYNFIYYVLKFFSASHSNSRSYISCSCICLYIHINPVCNGYKSVYLCLQKISALIPRFERLLNTIHNSFCDLSGVYIRVHTRQ